LPGKLDISGSGETVARLNGQVLRVLTLGSEPSWRKHGEGEVFLQALAAALQVEFREGAVVLAPGEMLIVPRNREYRLVAPPGSRVLTLAPTAVEF
jgi:quercetin dioxygenase-like cupin family protein